MPNSPVPNSPVPTSPAPKSPMLNALMPMSRIRSPLPAALLLTATIGLAPVKAQPAGAPEGYPTAERVQFVQECMRAHPGPNFEMLNKCSCAVDALAREVSYDDFTTMNTITNAMSIGGERGSTMRDNETVKPQIQRLRDLLTKAKRGCFINSAPQPTR